MLLIVNNYTGLYRNPVKHLGMRITENLNVMWAHPEKVRAVLFTGGSDVDPYLYQHAAHASTQYDPMRDYVDSAVAKEAMKHSIPMIGICRGAQFICVLAGGTLVQDLSGHARHPNAKNGRHKLQVIPKTGSPYVSPSGVTSTHHQIQHPFNLPQNHFRIIAHSPHPFSGSYVYDNVRYKIIDHNNPDQRMKEFMVEPDVVFYPKIKGLAIQFHPEYMSDTSWGFLFAQLLISNFLNQQDPLPKAFH